VNVSGKEIIELNARTLKRIKQIRILSRSKEYRVASIANLRLTSVIPSSWNDDNESLPSMTFSDGAISFDYGRSTCRLGSDLDEADAKYVIGEMRKRVTSLCLSGNYV